MGIKTDEMKICTQPEASTRGVRKKEFLKKYNPDYHINIKKTAESFGVTIQMVYRWIKSYEKNNK